LCAPHRVSPTGALALLFRQSHLLFKLPANSVVKFATSKARV
jgi:hypothetical protein